MSVSTGRGLFVPKDATKREHVARIDRVVWSADDDTRVIIALTDGSSAIGPGSRGQFTGPDPYRFHGKWVDSPSRGHQFHYDTFTRDTPASRAGVVRYLSEICTGIGQRTAEALFARFSSDAVRVLRETPEVVAAAGILSSIDAHSAAEDLERFKHLETTRVALFDLFSGRGFPGKLIDACLSLWGVAGPAIIRRNPFALLVNRLPGCGFRRVDRLYLDLGYPADSIKRQALAGWDAIRNDRSGSTWLPAEQCIDTILELIPRRPGKSGSDAKSEATRAMVMLRRAGWVRVRREEGKPFIGLKERADAEQKVARHIARLNESPSLWPTSLTASTTDGDRLPSAHQVAEFLRATRKAFGCFTGGPGTGKAMPVETPVLTPTGYRPIGDLKVGDSVVGSNGGPTMVSGVFPQGEVDTYRVTFSDGASVECCGEHLWFTTTRKERKFAQKMGYPLDEAGKVRNTLEVMATLRSDDDHTNHYIPLVQPVDFQPTGDAPIDPYLLGLLLGDAYLGKACVSFSNPEPELAAAVERLLPDRCRMTEVYQHADRCPSYRVVGTSSAGAVAERNPALTTFRSLGLAGRLSHQKFIPDRYKFGTVRERLAVLQGLLDTDGYTNGYNIEYSTSSPQLADDVVHLVESLGGICSVAWREPKFTHKGEKRIGKPSARVLVKLPAYVGNPFRLKRKADAYKLRTKYQPCRQVVSVVPVGRKNSVCISVTAKDQLYVADRFIVTHNTHTLAAALRQLVAGKFDLDQVRVCAPTGKASSRAYEAMRDNGVDVRATTIHQLLEVDRNGHDGDGWGFKRNRDNPLDCRVVIIDETSMVDVVLLASLLDACAGGTNVLCVGDSHQLPPVGNGAPLRDLLASGVVPFGELTEVRRNAGSIVRGCAAIKAGTAVRFDAKLDHTADDPKNLRIIDVPADQVANTIEDVLRVMKAKLGFDPVWETQVITGLNEKGDSSRVTLNARLGRLLNPDGVGAKGNPFRVGDKVVCRRNSWLKCVAASVRNLHPSMAGNADAYLPYPFDLGEGVKVDEWYVANGEFGRVVAVSEKASVIRFGLMDTPLIEVKVGKRGDAGGDNSVKTDDFEPAWAATCHLMQGSETPCVIACIDPAAKSIADKSFWYTAISRAKKACILIGPKVVFDRQVKKQSMNRRKTFLCEQLKDSMATA
jgi:hypothetical protein